MYSENLISSIQEKAKPTIAAFLESIEKRLGYEVVVLYTIVDKIFHNETYKKQNQENEYGCTFHNFGFAVAINCIDWDKNITYNRNTPKIDWVRSGIVELSKEFGLIWNGRTKEQVNTSFAYRPTSIECLKRKLRGYRDGYGNFNLSAVKI